MTDNKYIIILLVLLIICSCSAGNDLGSTFKDYPKSLKVLDEISEYKGNVIGLSSNQRIYVIAKKKLLSKVDINRDGYYQIIKNLTHVECDSCFEASYRYSERNEAIIINKEIDCDILSMEKINNLLILTEGNHKFERDLILNPFSMYEIEYSIFAQESTQMKQNGFICEYNGFSISFGLLSVGKVMKKRKTPIVIAKRLCEKGEGQQYFEMYVIMEDIIVQ